MIQNTEDIGRLLRHYRQFEGLLQKDMLHKIGMTQQQYQNVESGKNVRLSTLLRVLEGLGLTMFFVPNSEVDQVIETLNGSPDHQEGNFWSQQLNDLKD